MNPHRLPEVGWSLAKKRGFLGPFAFGSPNSSLGGYDGLVSVLFSLFSSVEIHRCLSAPLACESFEIWVRVSRF